MHRLTITLAALLWLVDCGAQSYTLDTVLTRLAATRTLRGEFDQTREIPGLSRALKSSGTFIVSEAGLYWAQQVPFESVLIADDSRLVQVVLDQPPVELSLQDQPIAASIGSVFVGIVTGQRALLERNFELQFATEGDGWVIRLTPKSELMRQAILSVEVHGAGHISSLVILGAGRDRVEVVLSQQTTVPAELTDEERALYQP